MTQPMTSTRDLMTPTEVSELLRIPGTTLAVWRCTGRIKLAYVKVGRAVRYRRRDVEQLIAQNTCGHDQE